MLNSETTQITIYTTSWCGPCKSAKRFLSDQGFDFTEIDIEKENISREEMESMTKGLTVPQIIINSEPIGGFEDLLEYFRQN
ncbi:MAG: glutaredoxin domain-containing protein [Candidatus Neomarinimicrobiota bacterium]|nr:glutaredoxin domain-containing protein [Candidatus Neomarinimicrobiota bacterium]MEE3241536.1 glutaredoxin domain-containing protein [Candidatus Neomarinimicrobiota bacterium]